MKPGVPNTVGAVSSEVPTLLRSHIEYYVIYLYYHLESANTQCLAYVNISGAL